MQFIFKHHDKYSQIVSWHLMNDAAGRKCVKLDGVWYDNLLMNTRAASLKY